MRCVYTPLEAYERFLKRNLQFYILKNKKIHNKRLLKIYNNDEGIRLYNIKTL